MFDFRALALKNLSKIRVVHNIPGRVRLKIPFLDKVESRYRIYDDFILRSIKILDGVEDLSINYTLGTVLITYDHKKIYEKKVLDWINEIFNVAIENIDLFEEYGEINLDYVVNTLQNQLKDKVKKYI